MSEHPVERRYISAREHYAEWGVDPDSALRTLKNFSLSLHCWQGDDVRGFETAAPGLSGSGIQATGHYPGGARSVDELRQDLEKALSLIPGTHRVNLHAIYGEFQGKKVDRDRVSLEHFSGWIDWAGHLGVKLDFNSTCFAHPLAESGFTLSHRDESVRNFWISHVKSCRRISAGIGKSLGDPCIHNLWIPDGSKDITVSRQRRRELLKQSLDAVFTEEISAEQMKDALESKLFGLGSETFVVGSHEFYLGYALCNGKMICLDTGHFHPTESVADKISALMLYCEDILIHVSRGIRWDSDHVVIMNDDMIELMKEIVRGRYLDRVRVATDFFDASMNRVGAWIIGARSVQKALLGALLEPVSLMRDAEDKEDYFTRLSLFEESKTQPFGAVWDYFCMIEDVPAGKDWIRDIQEYDRKITRARKS